METGFQKAGYQFIVLISAYRITGFPPTGKNSVIFFVIP
jgi:hypothetical protein